MKRLSPIYFLLKSEQERAEFLAAGVDLPRGKMMEGGEFIRFEIAEDDPRWDSFARVLRERLDRALKNRIPPGEAKVSLGGNAKWLATVVQQIHRGHAS